MIGYYPPAKRSGGPAKSVSLMTKNLKEFDFYVLCRNTDIGSRSSLKEVPSNRWIRHNSIPVFYASTSRRFPWSVIYFIRRIKPSVVYVCIVGSRAKTLHT